MEENRACPELKMIEKRCRVVDTLGGDELQILYLPCVMLQICKACVSIYVLTYTYKYLYTFIIKLEKKYHKLYIFNSVIVSWINLRIIIKIFEILIVYDKSLSLININQYL